MSEPPPPPYPGDQTKQANAPDAPFYPQQQPPPQQLYPQAGTVYYAPTQSPAHGPQQFVPGQPQKPTVVIVTSQPVQNFAGHIAFAGCSFCCCGVFGLVALVLAIVANSQASTQPESSRVLGKWSLGISVANIIIGIIGYTLLILWYTMAMLTMFRELAVIAADERNATLLSLCRYQIEGSCYRTRETALGHMLCRSDGYYNAVDRYCYFN